jgi:hypothetical protein
MLTAWSVRHSVSLQALQELHVLLTSTAPSPVTSQGQGQGQSESDVQARVRLAASQASDVLWRNNSGVLPDARGVPVRFGLCNESAKVNAACKSSDLIGIRRVLVTPAHVGHTLGVFYAREVKRAGWRYTGTPREVAQLRFIEAVVAMGGDAGFCTSEGDL